MRATAKLIGWQNAMRDIDRYVKRKQYFLQRETEDTGNKVQESAKRNAPTDLGELKRKITNTYKGRKTRFLSTVRSNAQYSRAVEYGSRPHWTSVTNLEGWAYRHGISPYAVQYKIAKHGTPEQPFMFPAYLEHAPKYVLKVKREMRKK